MNRDRQGGAGKENIFVPSRVHVHGCAGEFTGNRLLFRLESVRKSMHSCEIGLFGKKHWSIRKGTFKCSQGADAAGHERSCGVPFRLW